MISSLSSYVLTYNSERYLDRVLAQLKRVADEVIVADSGSTDNTVAIAQASGCRIETRPFTNFHEQRNWAQSLCSLDYVLYVDSDEIISESLVEALLAIKNRGFSCEAYQIRRDTFAFGRAVRAIYPATSPGYQIRLFRRSLGSFATSHRVHERLIGLRTSQVIEAPLEHYAVADLAELDRKLQLYTDLASEDIAECGTAPLMLQLQAWTRGPFAFVKWYGSRGGWKDGRVGLTLGRYAYRYTYLKYIKASRLARARKSAASVASKGATKSSAGRET